MRGRARILFFALNVLIALTALAAPPVSAQPRLTVQKLADGVWAAQPEIGANVGWFVLGDGVMVVDSGPDAATAREIVKKVAETAGKPIRYVVVTHAHGDHAGGAPTLAAAGAQVICQDSAAQPLALLLQSAGPAASDTGVLTVPDRLMFHGGRRRVEVLWLGPAHTRGDLIVLLPQEKVLFAGDLALNGRLPYLQSPDVDPRGWERALARLAASPVEKMVPGHGEIGPKAGLTDSLAYVRKVNELAEKFLKTAIPEEYYHIKLREPDNRMENVNVTDDHVANVKAVAKAERERLEKEKQTPGTTPTPAAAPKKS